MNFTASKQLGLLNHADAGIRAIGPDRTKRAMRPRTAASVVQQWELDDAITVVLFAGLGGTCEGLEEAGCPVGVANNHDNVALAAHAALHPHTRHVRGDIFDVDPIKATQGRRVKILWGSPDCTDFSVAKGGAPRSPRVRSLPWQMCRWAGKTAPIVIFVENVREIRGWGSLIAKRCAKTGRVLKRDGSVAAKGERVAVWEQLLVRDKKRAGRSFRAWVSHMRGLGYDYQDRDLNCADFGVPTARRRFFAVMRRDGQPIQWPERTHAPRATAASLGLLPWVPAASIIDWSLKIPSIFERKKELADAMQRRVAAGIKRYVLEAASPFLMPLTHHGEGRIYSIDDPLQTITTAHRGEFVLVSPTIVPVCHTGSGEAPGQAPRSLDISAPLGTVVAGGAKHALVGTTMQAAYIAEHRGCSVGQDVTQPVGTLTQGVHHAVVSAWMIQPNLGVVGHDMTELLSTLTTAGTQQQLGSAFLAKLRGTSTVADIEAPVPTLSAGGNHVAAVAAFLIKYYGTGGQDQGLEEPLHTLATKPRFGVVTVTIAGCLYAVSDIGMRMLEPTEAAAAHELKLPKLIEVDGRTRPLTKTEAMRLIGNSVPKRMARLLAQANAAHALYRPDARKMAAD